MATQGMMVRNTQASNLILEDHVRKLMSKGGPKIIEAKQDKKVPRVQHSPFGDFPKDYMEGVKQTKKMTANVKPAADVQLGVTGHQTLKKGAGSGGKAVTLNPKKETPAPAKPKAGAKQRRSIPVSEFRRFYDRGDLPI